MIQLSQRLHETVSTTDDNESRALLQELGLLHRIESAPVDKRELIGQSALRMNVTDHISHWIVFIKFFGSRRPEDNGYFVRCFPKNQISKTEFERMMTAEIKEQFPVGFTQLPEKD